MAWDFILTDLKGVQLGPLTNASARTVDLPHLRIPSATFQVPLWHERAADLLNTDTLLKCYRTDPVTSQRDLAFHGPVVSVEENATEGVQSLGVTAAGSYWRLTRRLLPGSKLVSGVSYGSAGALVDLGNAARTMIQDCNGAFGGAGFTGIDLGTWAASVNGWAGKYYLKNAGEAIAELSAGLSSFEFRVRPTEPTTFANPNAWPRIGLFDVAPILGTSQPDAIFEYGASLGGGKGNVSSYTRSLTRDNLLTNALISVQGWPDGVDKDPVTLLPKYNLIERPGSADATINARGMFEDVVNDAGVLDNTLRTQIADLHVALRKNPKETVVFTPTVNARPAPFVNYNVGDTVRARAVVNGILRFDSSFRVWGVKFDINESGDENVTLELVQP